MVPMATINQYASQMAKQPVAIVCDSPDTEGGDVRFDGWIHLSPGICWRLQHPQSGAADVGKAALALTHECEHYALGAGHDQEGAVEAAAYANVWTMIRRFKLSTRMAQSALAGATAYDQYIQTIPGYQRP